MDAQVLREPGMVKQHPSEEDVPLEAEVRIDTKI